MNQRLLIGLRSAAVLLAILIVSPLEGRAQETLSRWRTLRGPAVRGAFREVVAESRAATVRVLVDGDPVAWGVVVREDGWILTKASRLSGEVTCRLLGDGEYAAIVHSERNEHDLALLKIDARDLPVITWSDGDDARVGQWLATPGHGSSPLAVGIVSVSRRSIPRQRVRGVLGVRLEDGEGAPMITEIIADSAAEQAQLQTGDVVLRINDQVVNDSQTMVRFIARHEPGQTLTLAVQRADEELHVEVTLSHPFGQFLTRIAAQNRMGGPLSQRRSGFPAVLQHDTVLRPEECGGPVVNLHGEAVGLNIARAGRTESYAIPAGVIVPLLNDWLPDRARSERTASDH